MLQHVDSSPGRKDAIRQLVDALPRPLYELYREILSRELDHQRRLTGRLLQWLAFSLRPLQVDEAIAATAFSLGSDVDRVGVEDLLSAGGGMLVHVTTVQMDGNDVETLRLVHLSLQDFVREGRFAEFVPSEARSHEEMAATCLGYLLRADPDHVLEPFGFCERYRLAGYAARFWPAHMQKTDIAPDHLVEMSTSLLCEGSRLLNWVRLFNPDRPWELSPDPALQSADVASPLYYASSLGLMSVVKRLLDDHADPNSKGGGHGTPLQCAAYGNHIDIVKLLLAAGANPAAEGGFYGTASQAAKFAGNMEVLALLSQALQPADGPAGASSVGSSSVDPPRHIVFESEAQVPFDAEGPPLSHPPESASIVRKVRSRAGGFYCVSKTMLAMSGTSSYTTFVSEVSLMQKLRHRHVVKAIGSYSFSYLCTILMSPVADCDLGAYLHSSIGSSSDGRRCLVRWLGCVTDGLAYLHLERRVKHKDVKPKNILVSGDNVLWTDFGIAHEMADANNVTSGPTAHTDTYSAPEVAVVDRPERATAVRTVRTLATDIFSLGCVFAEMLTVICGESLADFENRRCQGTDDKSYRGTNGEAASDWLEELRPQCASIDGVPETIVDLVKRMLRTAPGERPLTEELVYRIPHASCKT